MKKLTVIIIIGVLTAPLLFGLTLPKRLRDDGRRHRVFILAGAGFAFSRMEGFSAEMGAEVRVIGDVYARLALDYYSAGGNEIKDGVRINHAFSICLYAQYKARIGTMAHVWLKAGGHVSFLDTRVHAFGVTFPSNETHYGPGAGLGFELQMNNHLSIYYEGTLKLILVKPAWSWFKTQLGIKFRVR